MLENSRLLRPIGYLKIKEEKSPTDSPQTHLFKINWGYPLFASIIAVAYFILHPKVVNPFAPNGLFDSIKQFLQILPGFYIAALAAIATFNKPSLDTQLDTPLFLKTREHGRIASRKLTRRHFLCYLFGYLSFLSIMLCLVHSVLINASPSEIVLEFIAKSFTLAGEQISSNALATIVLASNYTLLFMFMVFFFQLITVTLIGLFYLCDRLHWEEKMTIPKGCWEDTTSQHDDDSDNPS